MARTSALAGTVAVVTGASGRLGPVWIEALRAAGATVAGVDLRGGDGVVEANVTDRAALDAARAEIEAEHGPVTVLVNNAGIDHPPDPAAGGAETLEGFQRTVDVNLAGTFNAIQAFGPAMVE